MQFRFVLPCAVLALAAATAGAATTTATFEDFGEGIYDATLNDPLSGIRVHDIVSVFGNATIDDALPEDGYLYASGNYLTTNGYAPGPGGSLGQFSSLQIDLPDLAQNVSVDLIYITTLSTQTVTLNGRNSSGQVVATVSVDLPAAGTPPRDARLVIASLSRDIVSLSLETTIDINVSSGFFDAIDNVTFDATPEPASLSLALLAPLVMRRRR